MHATALRVDCEFASIKNKYLQPATKLKCHLEMKPQLNVA